MAEPKKPDLLITDYLGGASMAIDGFLDGCLAAHPSLRILMASGFNEAEVRLLSVKADRFLRKPFSVDELRQEVEMMLAG